MTSKPRIWFSLLALIALGPFVAQAATINLAPGGNLTRAVELAAPGDVILLANGTYTSNAGGGTQVFPDKTTFFINQGVTIRGNTANPALVILQASSADYSVRFGAYIDTAAQPADFPNGATLEGVTIQGSPYGVLVDNYTTPNGARLFDITLKDVIINATGIGDGVVAGGVSGLGPQRLVMDNVTVNGFNGNGFNLRNTIDSVLMNSRVTTAGTGLFVNGGARNVVVNNTFGNVPATNGTTLATSGAIFLNTQTNRFESNTVQGMRTDGLVFFNSTAGETALQAIDNYAGKNTIISNGFAATLAGVSGRDNGTGIWINCGANNSWLFANDVLGGPEAGLTIWSSKNNLLLGNEAHNNEDAGIYVAGGTDVYAECLAAAYRIKSTNNTLHSNAVYFNKVDSIVVRNADFTDLMRNFVSPTNGLGGAAAACATGECQSAFSFESPELTVNGSRVLRNTSVGTRRGLWVNFGGITALEFYGNRIVGSVNNRMLAPSTAQTLDFGATLGGNHWSQHTVSGNPGSTPFTAISFNNSNNINGPVSDRFPFQSESFGITQMTVSEPYAGDYAIGSARTVRWNAPGCTYVDISLDGTVALKTNQPNTGYAVVTIPSTSLAGHFVRVACKNSAGAATGQTANSPTFTVRSNELTLLAPGRDDAVNAGEVIPVAWKRTAFTGAVTIQYSVDNGVTYATVPGTTTYAGNFAYVTVPTVAATAYARIRITSATAMDTTDGVYAIRGTSPGFKNVQAGRSFTNGRLERLEWASPLNSRLVSITFNTGSGVRTVVNDLPDRGNYDWIVPDAGTSSSLVLTVNFKTSTGAPISTVTSNTAATAYAGAGGPFTLSVTALGSGTVTSSPAGINCPPTCEVVFPLNTVVTLSRTAGAGSTFFGYSGACTGTTCAVTMSADRGVVSSFYTGTLATRYRLYSPGTFEHLYTTDFNEYNVLPVCCAWVAEGAIYSLFGTAGSYGGVAAVPNYRLYNPFSFQHHWTTDSGEYAFLPSVGWIQEGIDGYLLPTPVSGALTLYRLYLNAAGGLHLWTVDENERNFLIANAGWVDEGIAGYVLPLQ